MDRIAVVTGASRGIGREIAWKLASKGFKVYGIARKAGWGTGPIIPLRADLADQEAIDNAAELIRRNEYLHVLVHAAGMFYQGTDLNEVSRQQAVNVQAPYYLTRKLIPRLSAAKGLVIFLNSMAALGSARPKIAQYAASKTALKKVADDLRSELNPSGVRVTSMFLGQVASEMQKANYELEGWEYRPELLMQPEDVAAIVLAILHLPARAEITELTLRSTVVSARKVA